MVGMCILTIYLASTPTPILTTDEIIVDIYGQTVDVCNGTWCFEKK